MENALNQKSLSEDKKCREKKFMGWGNHNRRRRGSHFNGSNITKARINTEYKITTVETSNHEIRDFLFTLGCYEGETITIISILADQYVIVVKDARYSIDKDLAECIVIE